MLRRFLSVFFCAMLLAVTVHAQDAAAPAVAAAPVAAAAAPAQAAVFTSEQRAAIDAQIKLFLKNNPQDLIGSVEAYYNKQADTKSIQQGSLTELPAGLLDYPLTPYVGPKDAKVAVVEFFDYNCGYCKQVAQDMKRVIDEEKGTVKFLFKELPILADSSELAARYALASNKQGKYLEYHLALMQHTGGITEGVLETLAKNVGLDVAKLKVDSESQDVRDALAKNLELARALGVRGTPFFVIGKEKVPGAIGYTKMIETLRQQTGQIPAGGPSVTEITDDPAAQKELLDAKTNSNKMVEDLTKQASEMQKQALQMMEDFKKQQAAGKTGAAAPAAPAAAPKK